MTAQDTQPAGISRRLLRTEGIRVPALLIAGLIGLALVLILTLWGEQLSGFEAGKQDLRARLLGPFTDGHYLGTD